MAVTENSYTGNGSTTNYSFTFPYLKSTDIEVQVDATVQATNTWSLANATTVQFNSAPANGAKIKILRQTNVDNLTATFYAGSAIKSEDLNDNYTQNLYKTQEVGNRFFQNTGGTMTGDLTMGEDASIVFEGATDNTNETTLTVADPTADRTITLPNVTGTVVTTGDTATVTATMLAANSVDSSELVDGSVDASHLAADVITGAKIADNAIDSEHYVDGSIDLAHLAADSVNGSKIADNSIDSEHYVDGSIDHVHLANDVIDGDNIQDDVINSEHIAAGAVDLEHMSANSVDSDQYVDGSIDRVHLEADIIDGTKLADNAVNSEHITAGSVDLAHMSVNSVDSDQYVDGSVDRVHLEADIIDSTKLADNAVGTEHIADAELTTLAGMQSGTASVLAGGTALAATLTEINTICDGKGVETTISDTDAAYPTSGAVIDYVAAQIAPIGGLEVIANDASFPEVQPAAGVVISIADAGGLVVNGSGVSTTGRTVASTPATVTINGINSAFNSSTVDAGISFMVSSTGSGQIYNFHKATLKEADILNLSNDINDFAARYRVNAGEPSSNNDEGDLVYDTNADKMKVYDSTTSAWKEVTSTGDFKYLFLCPAGGTGAPTINGSIATYDLREGSNSGASASVTNAAQLVVSVNGVIQKANTGTSAPAEGFALVDANTIIFSANLPSGASVFIHQAGSAVSIPTPGDDTVSTVKIQNLAVTTGKIADQAVDLTKLPHGDGTSNGKYLRSNNGADPTWETVSTTPTTTRGDIIYRAASADARLAKGSNGQVLTMGADDPAWADAAAGATGGGSDKVFWENGQTVTTDYTITNNTNAGTFGPVTINSGVTVTVGSGENWTIV